MAFTFKPAIYSNSTLYELPRPVVKFRMQEQWDYEQFKVPLTSGDTLVGQSLNGVDIAVEGMVGTQSGQLKTSEQDMFDELENMRSALNVSGSSGKYSLYIYFDVASATYRRFSDCTTVRFEYDISNKSLFTYSVLIHAEDPVLYTTVAS